MRKVVELGWLSVLCLLLVACNTFEVRIEPEAKRPGASPTASSKPSAAPTASATIVPPQGLVFQTAEGAWVTDASGGVTLLIHGQDAQISPDGTQILYEDEDLWLADLTADLQRNVTNTPDCWWPARPGTVIFGALPREVAPEPGWTGFLAAVDADGSDWRILDDQHQIAAPPALSPDGKTIAYGGGRTGWLYHWESGEIVPFDPLDYGLADILPGVSDSVQIGSPAWSPGGQRIAWVIAGESLGPEGSIGVGLFDLEARTVRLVHLHQPIGMEGWPPMPLWGADGRLLSDVGPIPTPIWSPDGRWLAFVTLAQDPRHKMLRVVQVDGQREQHTLGPGVSPVWSPDGRWLAFQKSLQEGAPPCLVVETGMWEIVPLDVPIGEEGRLVDWIHIR
jgi:dipeptidyl aminopeptidase/acylaminoacyl peptidase